MSSASPPSDISFKIRGKDSYHRFTLAAGEGIFDRLLEALREREIAYKKIYWIDEEGDRIALNSPLGMQDALSAGNPLIRLEVETQPEEGSNTATPNEHAAARRMGRRYRRSRSRSPRLVTPMLGMNAQNGWHPIPNSTYWEATAFNASPAHPFCRYCKH